MKGTVDNKIKEAVNPKDWFELKINKPESSSPAFEYAWCIGPKLAKLLLENDVPYPCLITTVYKMDDDGSYETVHREVCDLADGINMLPFRTAGDFKIFCLVAWYKGQAQANGDFKELAMNQVSLTSHYLKYDEKKNCVMIRYTEKVEILPYQASADISIDPKQFSPAPAEWLDKRINNMGIRPKTVMGWYLGCLLSFTIYPIIRFIKVAVFSVCSAFVVLGLITLGVRPWQIKYRDIVYNRFDNTHVDEGLFEYLAMFTDSSPDLMLSVWWYSDKFGQERSILEKILLCQPLWLILVCIVVMAGGFIDSTTSLWSPSFLWLCAKSFSAVMLFNFILCQLIKLLSRKQDPEEKDRVALERQKEKIRKRIEKYYPEKLEPLSCPSMNSFESIASKKASLTYRLKRKFYKPISES